MKNYSVRFLVAAMLCALSADVINAEGLTLEEQTFVWPDNEPAPCHPLPSARQLKWQDIEFYAFFHYGMNTYTDLEWGDGSESESLFAPTAVPDPRQWLEAVKAAGMRGGIAVVKHHDGFCLWPTATTTHNVTNSANPNAKKTNIPRDFAEAARDLGMEYGFYISPWDRNSAYWGTDRYVKEVFLPQCRELAEYGNDQFEMWFDGASGEYGYYGGNKDTRTIDATTYYDMPNLRDEIHRLLPQCIMWGVGDEARWIGNEEGFAGETDWSMIERGAASGESSRNTGQEKGWMWLPGESDAKATSKGWFWHSGQTELSPERLFQMYLETVGRNANLILNVPPDQSGTLPESSVKVLAELGTLLKERLGNDLATAARVEVSNARQNGTSRTYVASNMTDGDPDTYWAADDSVTSATITLTWDTPQTVRYVSLMEYIAKGQRVKDFTIETSEDGVSFTPRATDVTTTTIGHKRIIPLNGSTSASYTEGYPVKALRIIINDSRACPLLHTISVY